MTDLVSRFNQEVVSNGREATLPVNLNNEWLEVLSQSLDEILEGEEDLEASSSTSVALVLQAILHILMAKESPDVDEYSFEITTEKLFRYFEEYRLEISLENINRKTKIKSTPATIDSIFTNRKVVLIEEI